MDPFSDPAVRDLLPLLRARQIAFLEERLVSPAAQEEWRRTLPEVMAVLWQTPLGTLIPEAMALRLLDEALAETTYRTAVHPVMIAALPSLLAALRSDNYPLATYVPGKARAALEELVVRPGLLPEPLLRAALEHEAVEGVLQDVLHDVLQEFSEKVNPFFAESGLPSLLRRFLPGGFGALGKAMDHVQAEFTKRLEPELRTFLQGVTRRALRSVADRVLAAQNSKAFLALRQHLLSWMLEQTLAQLLAGADDGVTALVTAVGGSVGQRVISLAHVQEAHRRAVSRFWQRHGEEPIGNVLQTYGISYQPASEVFAEALWPWLDAAFRSPPVRQWLASLVDEFYDTLLPVL